VQSNGRRHILLQKLITLYGLYKLLENDSEIIFAGQQKIKKHHNAGEPR
jgi:hypothetical protein